MPIDLYTEKIVTLNEATKLLPRLNGKKISLSTLWRWCRKGVRGVYLEHARLGGRICTSAEALNRFANGLAQADIERLQPAPPPWAPARRRWSARREAEIRAAEAELKRLGF